MNKLNSVSAALRSTAAIKAMLVLGSAALPALASAQVAPGTLPSREQVQPQVPETAPPPLQVRVDGRKAFRETPCAFETATNPVTIDRLRFTGNGGAVLPPEILSLLAGIEGTGGQQPLSAVCDIRDRANAALRDAGYIASVQIPPQEITGNELALVVITAKLVDVRVAGKPGRYADLVAARAERLKGIDPFNQHEAERLLLVAGDVPGLDVQLSLSPAGTVPGEVVGTLTVAYSPYALIGNVQNYGSRSIGRETAYLRAEAYGLTGMADSTYVGLSTTLDTDEQQVFQLGHSFGVDPDGTRVEGSFTYAWSQPDVGILDVRSRSLVGTLAVSHPLVRTGLRNFNLSGGLDFVEQRTRFFGLPLTRDKLRIAFLRLDGNLVEPDEGYGYALSGGIELRRGLDIFNATERYEEAPEGWTPSRIFGDPTATVLRLDLDSQVKLNSIFTVSNSVRAQYASQPLLNYEEFSVGSLSIGRGYDPGANGGDSAIGTRSELRAAAYRTTNVAAEVFGFVDNAWIWNKDRITTEKERQLGSIGFGTRVSLPGNLFLEAMYAHPMDRALSTDAKRAPDRFLVSLTAQFAPRAR
ncbi:ShlB/FhaC/HecB family hemolysin secretion/activation protein [Allosphingosinicella flava]|uniref:ShlB/FhaC/HecB family hemolysin secretion/activation protein n=1 Tax=Allosphingosinicella flava TaxID=2771430 RepID=A0A7T2GK70_9SPHN|nr:ShlB/FhaC/HecB family hemolysin secretion/activation protein [Sphingosinicella flava]QPQ55369.1 ShlB/FhaC/HecB family hemolysin secretion/activation protein [Sphingosinicella flava]